MSPWSSHLIIGVIVALVWFAIAGFAWLLVLGGSRRQVVENCEHGVAPEYCPECYASWEREQR